MQGRQRAGRERHELVTNAARDNPHGAPLHLAPGTHAGEVSFRHDSLEILDIANFDFAEDRNQIVTVYCVSSEIDVVQPFLHVGPVQSLDKGGDHKAWGQGTVQPLLSSTVNASR